MFDRPIEAVAFSLAYQRGLRELADADGNAPLRARVGIHVGDVVAWDNAAEDIAKGAKPFEVEGIVKPTTSRLMQLALPGHDSAFTGVAYQLAHRSQDELGGPRRDRTSGARMGGIGSRPAPIPLRCSKSVKRTSRR